MIHSFLLIGQSNMAGRGRLDEAVPVNPEKIRVMRNGRWQGMFRPVNPDRPFSGVNLAESFAERYADVYGVNAGIIPCADGGTSLWQWEKGSILFENAVNHVKLAKRTSAVAGVLWHQGEGDCSPEDYAVYEEKFRRFMADFREAADLWNVPFLLGGLGDFLPDRPGTLTLMNYGKVNEALENVASDSPMTAFVPAAGLGANPDNLHFSSAALYEFGHRYFEAWQRFEKDMSWLASVIRTEDEERTEMELL